MSTESNDPPEAASTPSAGTTDAVRDIIADLDRLLNTIGRKEGDREQVNLRARHCFDSLKDHWQTSSGAEYEEYGRLVNDYSNRLADAGVFLDLKVCGV